MIGFIDQSLSPYGAFPLLFSEDTRQGFITDVSESSKKCCLHSQWQHVYPRLSDLLSDQISKCCRLAYAVSRNRITTHEVEQLVSDNSLSGGCDE